MYKTPKTKITPFFTPKGVEKKPMKGPVGKKVKVMKEKFDKMAKKKS